MEYNKVYHNENVECNTCRTSITRKAMFKHTEWPSCKAIANVCRFYIEMLDDEHKEDTYSSVKTEFKSNPEIQLPSAAKI